MAGQVTTTAFECVDTLTPGIGEQVGFADTAPVARASSNEGIAPQIVSRSDAVCASFDEQRPPSLNRAAADSERPSAAS